MKFYLDFQWGDLIKGRPCLLYINQFLNPSQPPFFKGRRTITQVR